MWILIHATCRGPVPSCLPLGARITTNCHGTKPYHGRRFCGGASRGPRVPQSIYSAWAEAWGPVRVKRWLARTLIELIQHQVAVHGLDRAGHLLHLNNYQFRYPIQI